MARNYVVKLVILTVGLFILYNSLPFAQQEAASFYRTSWALLVGVNKYPHLPPKFQLNYAVNDVEVLAKLLIERFEFPKDNITILKDEQANQKNILDQLSDLANTQKIGKNDRVLVFFSGHGQTLPLPSGGEMGFLIPHDAEVDLSDVKNPAQYYKSCIGMDELNRRSLAIPAKHLLFIVDACYSGLAADFQRGLDLETPGFLQKVAKLPVRQIITAGLKGEQVIEKPQWGHGAFTYKLLEALRTGASDWNNDSVTTSDELATYLRNVVPKIAPQTPHHGRFAGEGEFLFVHAEALPTDTEPPHIELIEPPNLRVTGRSVQIKPTGSTLKIVGRATDNVGVVSILVDGEAISFVDAVDGTERSFEIIEAPTSPNNRTVHFEAEIVVSSEKPREVKVQAVDVAGNRNTVSLDLLPPGKGRLLVKTIPMGSKIYVDGKFIAYADKVIKNLPAGKRKVRLVLGERVHEAVITIRDGATEKLNHSW